MYFVLGSIVIAFAGFFGYIAKQVFVGAENSERNTSEEHEPAMRRSVS